MSKAVQKRYRQINIKESFALAKKARTESETPAMDPNLRNLLATAALKRLEESKITQNSGTVEKFDKPILDAPSTSKRKSLGCPTEAPNTVLDVPSTSIFEALASSAEPPISTVPKDDEGDGCLPSTSGFIDCSAELFPDSPTVEQCSSQEGNSQVEIDSQPISSNPESPVVEEYDTQVDSGSEANDLVTLLNRIPDCRIPLPELEPLENHSIMFSPHIRPGDAPRPYPSSYRDKWNENYVRMPCSPDSKYAVEDKFGKKHIISRWDLICGSLRRRILTSHNLEEAIMAYNTVYKDKWNFDGLHAYFDTCLSDTEREQFFDTVLPRMVETALKLPEICTQPIPLLKKRRDYSLTMSQKQISCLLLNAFFCTFPRRNLVFRNPSSSNREYASYPDINFNRLFGVRRHRVSSTLQKLHCLFNYFRRVTLNEPTGTVTFHRQFLPDVPTWDKSRMGIRTAFVKSEGLIEADGQGLLQVDFANKFVGGGVLATGCIQEEIRFVICPELIISRLFVECLEPKEALIVTGVEQYNSYKGYSDTFKWTGDFQDQTVRDDWGRRCTELVAINATAFRVPAEQYQPYYVKTEIDKAYCGFYQDSPPSNLSAVATGNWGCGAFKGDPYLKFLIQLIAASAAGRDILYFTFGNKTLRNELREINELLSDKNLSVCDLFKILKDYYQSFKLIKNQPSPRLYDYLRYLFSEDEETEVEGSGPVITDSDRNAMVRLFEDVENSQ